MKKINLKDFISIKDLKKTGKTGEKYNIIAKVVKTYNFPHKKIIQAGLAEDKSEKIRYVIWRGTRQKKLSQNKIYVFQNVKLAYSDYHKARGFQVYVTSETQISLYKKENVLSENLPDAKKNIAASPSKKIINAEEKSPSPQNQERPKTFCSEKTLHKILQLNKEELKKIEKKKKELAALHKKVFKSRALKTAALLACLMIIVYAAHFVYDYSVRTSLKTGDIIKFESAAGAHSFKVSDYDKESDMVTAVSQDEYKEEIHIKRLARVEKISAVSGQRSGEKTPKNYVYSYNITKQDDHISPDIISTKIYVNSEKDDEILKKLPGIGVKRLKDLKAARPFKNIQDVMSAKIGVGPYWAEQWEKGVKLGTVIFD